MDVLFLVNEVVTRIPGGFRCGRREVEGAMGQSGGSEHQRGNVPFGKGEKGWTAQG